MGPYWACGEAGDAPVGFKRPHRDAEGPRTRCPSVAASQEVVVNKIVIHTRGGGVVRGSTGDFRPNREKFHVTLENGEVAAMSVENLKAVFFVKDLAGDSSRDDAYTDEIPGGGRKVQVTFQDGEVITGFTTAYSAERLGWFLVPADEGSNNLRIFVVNAAAADVEFIS